VSSPGLDSGIVEFAVRQNVAAIPGALTPTEVMMACNAGADLIKVFPCAAVGIRGNLIPPEATENRDQNWIRELAGRFLGIVQRARAGFTPRRIADSQD
jgi:2-keto-3-deoxy-6-phosphogluconate aldolase